MYRFHYEDEYFLTIVFWALVLCYVRVIIYMEIHPSISSITTTFEYVGFELISLMLSFGIIFLLLAFIAHDSRQVPGCLRDSAALCGHAAQTSSQMLPASCFPTRPRAEGWVHGNGLLESLLCSLLRS